jgi:hypothetical protein
MASNLLINRSVLARNRSAWCAVMLLGAFGLQVGQKAVTNAYAQWAAAPAWDNPDTLGLTDINSLVSKAKAHTDPGRDVSAFVALLPRLKQTLLPGQPGAVGNPTRTPDHSRDPPSSSTRTESHVR